MQCMYYETLNHKTMLYVKWNFCTTKIINMFSFRPLDYWGSNYVRKYPKMEKGNIRSFARGSGTIIGIIILHLWILTLVILSISIRRTIKSHNTPEHDSSLWGEMYLGLRRYVAANNMG